MNLTWHCLASTSIGLMTHRHLRNITGVYTWMSNAALGSQGEEVLPFLRTGPRVESVNDLGSAIGGWEEIGSRYRAEQERLIAHTFALSEVPASQRAADAIAAAIARRNGAL